LRDEYHSANEAKMAQNHRYSLKIHPLIIVGLILPVKYNFVVTMGIALYSLAVLFQLVTLPVEFNASFRAIKALDETGILYPDELEGAKKVLTAAAMTYLAASFTAIMSLLRLLVLAGNRRGGDE
jgi:Zn-dependent membrane protease YugP